MRGDMRNKKVKVIVFSTILLFVLSLGGIFKFVETKEVQAIEREKQIALEEKRLKGSQKKKRRMNRSHKIVRHSKVRALNLY